MKVMFVARAMDNMAGGVERMICNVMNEMSQRDLSVSLLTWDHEQATPFYKMDSRIKWYKFNARNLGKKASLLTKTKRFLKARIIFHQEKPDVVICFQSGAFIALRLYWLGFKTTYKLLRLSKKIVIQCESYKKYYPDFLQKKLFWIPNPVKKIESFQKRMNENNSLTILSVGRLSFQKNYLVLLKAFLILSHKFPNITLKIIGEGEERNKLESFVSEHPSLKEKISLPGVSKNVSLHYKEADIFCLPSLWEGFPNALAEALSHGLPSVGFKDCDGINELIENEKNGLLVTKLNDHDELAKKLESLISNQSMRKSFSDNAIKISDTYPPKKIYDQWEKLIRESV